jgi:S-DNA-T family DNA segregation ATPase FtsK/SpoIIIE
MPQHDGAIQPYEGQIHPSGAHIAFRQQAMFEGLLPAPRSAVTFRDDGPSLARRAIEGVIHGALTYKAVLLTPLLAPFLEGAASALHYVAHSTAIGASMIAVGTLFGGVGTILSLAHVTNPPTPHHIGTHHAGHAGKIIVTAFGTFLLAVAEGFTTWLGPFSGGSWAVGIAATAAGMLAHAMRIHESGGHKEIRGTDRIRAVAELAAATTTQGQNLYMPAPTPGNHHPLSQQVLYALSLAGFPGASVDGMPIVVNPNKWSVTVNLPDGVGPAKVVAKRDDLASTLKVIAGGLTLTRADDHQVTFAVNNTAIADLPPAGAHPILELEPSATVSVWDPFHFGLDDDGRPVRTMLAGRAGILIAGSPGSGKSNATAQVVCTVVRAPDCELWTIDGSGRELVIFDKVARYHSRFDMDEAIDLLSLLREELVRRGEILADYRATEFTREIAQETDTKAIAYVIGELSFYTADDSQPKKSKEFNSLLRDIGSRSRACAVFGILDTQKPEDRIVPSFVRDMFPLKLALRCETAEQVVTILGRGMDKLCPAHTDRLPLDEDGKSLGFGYFKGIPGRAPFRLQTHRITAEERYAIVDAHAPQVADSTPPDGPGGGQEPAGAATTAGWRGTHLRPVPCYPDGERIGENYVALWESLDKFPDGFTYRDVAAAGVMKGRGSVQGPLDMWRNLGYIVACGERQGPAGPKSAVYRKVEASEYGREQEAV